MLPLNPAKGSSWEVKSSGTVCSATDEAFEPGEAFMSRLVKTREGLAREDFKLKAWDKERRNDALFYWKTQFRLPPPKKEEPFKEENAEEALRELVERNDPSLMNTIYILAVMLERKRLLIERGDQRDADGNRIRIYEHKDSGETFFVMDPELELEEIAEVQHEVALELGWIKEGDKASEPELDTGSAETEDGVEAKNLNTSIDNPED